MQKPLDNYLRAHRKRAGLTVAEVAYLIGKEHGSTVSRHELGTQAIDLETALAYCSLFGVEATELFEGRAVEVQRELRERAAVLAETLRAVGRRKRATELLERLAQDDSAGL